MKAARCLSIKISHVENVVSIYNKFFLPMKKKSEIDHKWMAKT